MQYYTCAPGFVLLACNSPGLCILPHLQLQRFSNAIDPCHTLESYGVFLGFCSSYIGHALLQTLLEDIRFRKLNE